MHIDGKPVTNRRLPVVLMPTSKTYSAVPWKLRKQRKAGPTRNGRPWHVISKKAFCRPNAASLSTALRPAGKSRH